VPPLSAPRSALRVFTTRIALLLAWLFASAVATAQPPLHAQAGVFDLSGPDGTTAAHTLRGEWGFAWERFLAPTSSETLATTAPVPAPWNPITADGKPRGPDGFASYTLQVDCPVGKQLALLVPTERTAVRVYVNGRLAASQGAPGMTPESARPAVGRRTALTDPFACPLHIVVHVSNWSHREGGMIRAPIAGPTEELGSTYKQRLALDTILLGAYLVLSIAPIFFYFARPRDKAPLLFGLFCLAQTVYADMTGERLLLQMGGGETPWEVFLKLQYLSWYGSMALFVLLVHQLFQRTLHPRLVRGAVGLCLLAMAAVVVTPARVYSQSMVGGETLCVAMGLYIAWAMARALRQRRKDAGVILGGLGFLLLVVVINLLEFYAEAAQSSITAFGLLAFVLSPALVLLRRLARMLSAEEQRSAEQREKVDLLVRATHAGILDWDYTRNLTRYSPRLLEIMGYPPETDTDAWPLFFEQIHPGDRDTVQGIFMAQLRDRSVRGGEMKHEPHEYRLVRVDGSAVWVHAEAISLRAADGRTLRYICSLLDITDQRAVAEGLKRQNAALAENAQLREDVERMSRHDLKTPLNSIIGVARLLREDAGVAFEHRELLLIAERAGYRMLEMVNLSLDLSRMELGTYDFRPQAVNVVDVIARVVLDLQGLAQSSQVQVRMATDGGAPVYARAEELLSYSILANLVKNAIEATPAGGAVTVRLENGDPLRVRVHNPGPVPQAVAGRFFDKYVTAGKSGGTGLGTYSARLMARVQEGDLEMRTGDTGTVLTLTLRGLGREPLPTARAPSAAGQAALGAADFRPRRVLLVDDDEYNRLLLLRYLPSPPFTVESAGNGQAAIDAMNRNWPDIVLADLEMPVMNGLELVAWIRERERREGRRPCLVVMMSSNDDEVSIRRGLDAGSNRYLPKPFTREALLALLYELDLGGPTTSPGLLEATQRRAAHEATASDSAPVRIDPELRSEVPAFLESRRQLAQAMARALGAGDRVQLRTLAHRAAGGLALFGFEWAAWQCRQISAQAAEGDAQALAKEIERLLQHLRVVQVL
jgi:signal transduction histidine kinase/DNA-binding NarL/FixJ family response regulator